MHFGFNNLSNFSFALEVELFSQFQKNTDFCQLKLNRIVQKATQRNRHLWNWVNLAKVDQFWVDAILCG